MYAELMVSGSRWRCFFNAHRELLTGGPYPIVYTPFGEIVFVLSWDCFLFSLLFTYKVEL